MKANKDLKDLKDLKVLKDFLQLLEFELQLRADVIGGKTYLGYEIARLGYPLLGAVVVEREGASANSEAHIALLTWLKENLLESLQFFFRTRQ